MKKLLVVLVLTFFSTAAFSIEFSAGISGNIGTLDAKGKETISGSTNAGVDWGATSAGTRAATATAATTQETEEELVIGYASIWGEAHLDENVRVGLSYVPYALESETTENSRNDNCSHAEGHLNEPVSTQVCTATTNKVGVDLVNLASLYLSYHQNNFFVKAGVITADIETNESLETGSKYDDASLEGAFIGAGVEKDLNNDLFVRTEISLTKFDDIKLTASGTDNTNTIEVNNLDGINATVSIGKTF